jgi:uncharacterized membrane protein HdeD (DUF308 family)
MLPVAPIQYQKCDRLCERMLVVLVVMFVTGIAVFALLDATLLRNFPALRRTSEFVAEFVLWPLLICWLGINGVLVCWNEVLQRRSPGGQVDRWSAGLFVAVLILGLSAIAVGFFLLAWALKG